MPLEFDGIHYDELKFCCEHVYAGYPELHDCLIRITRGEIQGSTMQAQPVIDISSVYSGFDKYVLKIANYVRDSENYPVHSLDRDVIIGWLAHEFGHLLDYQDYSNLGMAIYGLRYILSPSFARKVENKADVIAVHHGFYKQVRKTKEFLLGNSLGEAYRNKLITNYMSIEDLELCNLEWEARSPG